MTPSERQIVLRLIEREPGTVLALVAECLAPVLTPVTNVRPVQPVYHPPAERRAGEDPFLIDEDEFSYRARNMSADEQAVLRCRVNAARAHKSGSLDRARRYRQRADRLERKLMQETTH